MKITVDRTNGPEEELIFTITVKEPHLAPFGDVERNLMLILESCKKRIESQVEFDQNNKLMIDITNGIHIAKEKAFNRVLENLKFAIKNELEPKFKPICQEIYNWIHDNQHDFVKTWMNEMNPQRTKYYFDNDKKNQQSASEFEMCVDKLDEDDED